MAPRILPAVGLFFLSPVCAEYLIGYDNSTGDAVELLGGLIIFGPLYGAVALIIREVAVGLGLGWGGIAGLAAAAGLVQAGMIDQSLFNLSYRDISYWDAMVQPTFIPLLGTSAYMIITFVGGHLIWSFCMPILVVQQLSGPLGSRAWLGRVGLVVVSALYLAAAALVYLDQARTEQFLASGPQLVGTAIISTLVVVVSVRFGRRRSAVRRLRVPPPWLVGLGAAVAGSALRLTPTGWVGVALGVLVLAGSVVALVRVSRSTAWTDAHVLALGIGVLASSALFGFLVEPIGDVPAVDKFGHNATMVLLVGVLAAWGVLALRRQGRSVVTRE